jgi:cell division protein FtsZ
MEGARKILLSITGGRDLSLWEVNEAAGQVQEAAHPDANIIFGAMVDESLENEVWVTVVATGYEGARSSSTLREPAGEPRVTRTRDRGVGGDRISTPRPRSTDVDVPEFIPRF